MREARVIPDVEDIIVETVQQASRSFDYVFTTGGIGPTHDDITAACVAKAFDRALYEHATIAEVIKSRAAPPEVMASRMLMARVP
jgi:molybdopterin-biosynthesis enzyme MoeA-like protein